MERGITTSTCQIFVDNFGILHVKMLKGITMDLGDAVDNFLVARNLTHDKPVIKLVDERRKGRILKQAKAFIEKENMTRKPVARAVLVSSFVEKYLRSFYLCFAKKQFPVKIFTSEEKAMTWLRSFIICR